MLQASNDRLRSSARRLRKSMSLPEVLLWQQLKLRPGGYKFRRQQPAGNYVLDFYCHEARLIVEVDGAAHDVGQRPLLDERRDADFAAKGLLTLRISAAEVLRDPAAIADAIARSCDERRSTA